MSIAERTLASRQVLHARDLLFALVSRDFRARYTDSMLGFLWAVLNPLAQLLIYWFLFQRVLELGIRRYSSLVFIGVVAWGWFSSTVSDSVRALKGNREVIEQPGFPAAVLPLVSVSTNMIDFLIAIPLIAIIILLEGYPLYGSIVALPIVIAIQFAFTLGLSYLVAGVNAAFPDTQHIVRVMLRLYFFLTPVFYALDSIPERYRPLFDLNPMTHILEAYRAIFVHGWMPAWTSLAVVALLSVMAVAAGMRVYRWARYRYLEQI